MTHPNINWHLDRRVTPLLGEIARDGLPLESYQDYSNSSWGMKSYTRPIGKAYAKLKAIYDEYQDRIFAEHFDAFADFVKLPDAATLARFAAGHHMYRPDLIPECERAMPGGFDRRELAA